jgi:hypothetical protein
VAAANPGGTATSNYVNHWNKNIKTNKTNKRII